RCASWLVPYWFVIFMRWWGCKARGPNLQSRKRSAVLPFLFHLFGSCSRSRSMPVAPHSVDDALGRWSRRRFLARNALGLGSVALAWLLREENLLATPPNMPRQPQSFDLKPKVPLLPPRARAMISLFMHGGPSHIDLLDPQPELTRRSGEDYGSERA